MARYTDAVCRLCRREGLKLYLKGSRCYTKKCGFERRPTPPGQHIVRRRKVSEYGVQLREKQKIRRVYSVLERQFRRYFEAAEVKPGMTGENLLRLLEQRLDNVVYRAGWASTRPQARQFVNHGLIQVDGKRVDIASYRVRKGEVVQLGPKAAAMIVIQHNIDTLGRSLVGLREQPLRLVEQAGVLEGDPHARGDGRQEALVGFAVGVGLGAFQAHDADHALAG
jgi:small subunit ribosomal protein S4